MAIIEIYLLFNIIFFFQGVKVVSPCISKLMTKHVKLLAKKCESIVLMKPTEKCGKMSEHRWTFKDRSYATQLLARLIFRSFYVIGKKGMRIVLGFRTKITFSKRKECAQSIF